MTASDESANRGSIVAGPLRTVRGLEPGIDALAVEARPNSGTVRACRTTLLGFVLGLLSLAAGVLAIIYRSDAWLLAVLGLSLPGLALSVLAWKQVPAGAAAGWGLALSLCGLALGFLGLPAASSWDEAEARSVAQTRLRLIGRAMQLYADDHGGRLPPAVVCDKKGRPLYSWRVLLLPYLGQQRLYRSFQRDEQWDSPHNQVLLSAMPEVYAPPPGVAVEAEPFATFCQVIVGPGTAFGDPDSFGGSAWAGLKDTAKTLRVVEAGAAVPWTKPADLSYAENRPLPSLGGVFTGPSGFRLRSAGRIRGFHATLADGEVRFVTSEVDEATLRELIVGVSVSIPY